MTQRVGKLLPERLAGHRCADAAAVDGELGAQRVERVLDLLARVPGRAAQQHLARELAVGLLAEGLLQVGVVERNREADGLAARLLGQERDLRPIGQHEALGARIEIRGARVERLARGGGGVALVILDYRGEVDRRRNRRARGLRVGNELADGDVRPLQVFLRDAVDAGGGDRAIAVARDEEQTPVAQRDRFRDRDRESLRVRHRLVEIDCRLAADARDLRFGHGLLREAFDRREHRVARRRERIGVGDLREERERPRLAQLAHPRLDGGRLLRRHQRLVEASGGRDGQHVAQHVERDKVRMRAAHRVVHHAEKFRPAGAAQRHRPLAVLHGLLGVDRRQRARGLRDRPEILDDEAKRRVGIELAGDDQHRVVGLVVEPVERLQPADVDVLDVRARADLQVPVVVPHVGRGEHPAVQHELRIVLAASRTRCARPSSRNRGRSCGCTS